MMDILVGVRGATDYYDIKEKDVKSLLLKGENYGQK